MQRVRGGLEKCESRKSLHSACLRRRNRRYPRWKGRWKSGSDGSQTVHITLHRRVLLFVSAIVSLIPTIFGSPPLGCIFAQRTVNKSMQIHNSCAWIQPLLSTVSFRYPAGSSFLANRNSLKQTLPDKLLLIESLTRFIFQRTGCSRAILSVLSSPSRAIPRPAAYLLACTRRW